jgi:hypothetical protein
VQNGRHALTLVKIEAQQTDPPESTFGQRAPFNLIFTGPPDDVLVEGMYVLEVEGGPSFELYVMPVHTPHRGRQDYQSSFN